MGAIYAARVYRQKMWVAVNFLAGGDDKCLTPCSVSFSSKTYMHAWSKWRWTEHTRCFLFCLFLFFSLSFYALSLSWAQTKLFLYPLSFLSSTTTMSISISFISPPFHSLSVIYALCVCVCMNYRNIHWIINHQYRKCK